MDRRLANLSLALSLLIPFSAIASAGEPIEDVPYTQEYRGAFIKGKQPQNDVKAVAIDKQGTLWAATAAGLFQVDDDQSKFVPTPLNDGPVFDVAVDHQGGVWAAAWNGLYRLVKGKPEKEPGLDGPVVVVKSLKDRLFATTPNSLFEKTDSGWQKIPGPWAGNIRDVAISPDGLYVASWSGLYYVNDGQTTKLDQSKSFLSRNVSSLAVDSDGAVWIGSRAGIDVARGAEHLRSLTPKGGLPSTDVRSLAFDANGRLWIGTELGMVRYDGKRWSLRHSLRWLPNDETRDVAFAEDGTAWVATAGGISPIKSRTMTLEEKAAFFLKLARDRHVRAPGLVEKCRLDVPGDLSSYKPMDTDNDGSYTGLYLAAECHRFAVTGAVDAKKNAIETYRALEFLQTVTETDGFVARTVIPADWTQMADANRTYTPQEEAARYAGDVRWKKVEERWRLSADKKWLWKGDTSSDEISGHFFAYGVYYDLVADEKEKQRVAALVHKLMDYLIDGGYNLRDIDGKHTRWGVWSPEKLNGDPNWWLERGCNSVELLSFLTVAKHVTGDPKYDREIEKLLTEHHFAENILTPMSPYNDYFTYIGFELLAMSYPALLSFEKDPERRALYLKSLENWFAPVRKDASLFYSFVYAAHSGGKIRSNRCAEMLREMPLDQIRWRIDNSRREDLRLVHRPAEDALQLNRLLPASERPVFRWDRNVYDAVNGDGGRTEGCAVVWLMPYWMGRHYGLIKPPTAD